MAIGKDSVTINVEIDREVKETLKAISDKLEISVSSLANNLIQIGLHDSKVMRNTGISFIALNLKKFLEDKLHIELKGHPKIYSDDLEIISITMKKDTKERLDQCANEYEIPVKKLVRNSIYITLDDHDFLQKTGLIKIAYRFRAILESDEIFEKKLQEKKALKK